MERSSLEQLGQSTERDAGMWSSVTCQRNTVCHPEHAGRGGQVISDAH